MKEKLSACPVCGKEETKPFLEGVDYFLTSERFSIDMCNSCGFRFTNPRPTVEYAGRYYQTAEYISHDAGKSGIIPTLYGIARRFTLRSKYQLVSRFSKGNSILDIGCGTGEFLDYCQRKGMHCLGVEPSEKARNFATANYRIPVMEDFLTGIDHSRKFDCITLWHVLEHIHKLDETMAKLYSALKEDGVLIVALPNSNSHDARYYGKFWAAYDLPRHIYHFTRETLIILAGKFNFTCEAIIPQKLDAYYIAMLSEKYRSGSTNYFRALFQGLASNMYAGNTLFGHSSEIYILKRKNS